MKILLQFAFLFSAVAISAQPVITSADMPGPGASVKGYEVTNHNTIDTNYTGSNVAWDFSGLTLGLESTSLLKNPAGHPQAHEFPTATLVAEVTSSGGSPTYIYSRVTPTHYGMVGTYSANPMSASLIKMDPDMIYFPFPLNINTAEENIPINGVVYSETMGETYISKRGGVQSIKADGFGTITTPRGTVENVLRVIIRQRYADTLYYEGVAFGVTEYVVNSYNWVSKTGGTIVLNYVSGSGNGTPFSYANVSELPTVSLAELGGSADFSVYPNPASGQLFISSNTALTEGRVDVISPTGQLVSQSTMNGTTSVINLQGLTTGLYILKLSSENSTSYRKFFIE